MKEHKNYIPSKFKVANFQSNSLLKFLPDQIKGGISPFHQQVNLQPLKALGRIDQVAKKIFRQTSNRVT